MLERTGRRAEIRDAPPGCQKQHLIAQLETSEGMRHDQHRASAVGELAEELHHRSLVSGIEAGSGLVQEEQRRLGQEFERDTRSLALTA